MAGPLSATGTAPRLAAWLTAGVAWIAATPARAFLIIFLVAFSVGLSLLPFVPPLAIVPHTRWEVQAVAVSLATTGTFADPYALATGPTAHMPPAYPALLALLYKVFGLTLTAGYVAWALKVSVSATMVAMLPWLSRRLGTSTQAGVIGGLAGALAPRWPYEVEYFAAVGLGLLLAWHVRRWSGGRHSLAGSLLLGIAWGAAFHLTASLLAVLLACLLFELWWSRDLRKGVWSAVVVAGVALACAPWGWRNYAVFGEVFFIRSNAGLELRMGNHDGAVADVDVMDVLEGDRQLHPRTNLAEARLVQQLGEMEYMRRARRQALEWIRTHPGAFLELSVQRAFHFWFGAPSTAWMAPATAVLTIVAVLGLRRSWPGLSVPQRAAFLVPLLTYPPVYYVVVFMPRYGAPLTGLLLVLAGAEVSHWIGGPEAGRDGCGQGPSGNPPPGGP